MGCAPVSFDYNLWVQTFPEFSAISEPQATLWFGFATIIQRNDGCGPVSNPVTQLSLLNLVTAHLVSLYLQSQDDPSPGAAKDANTPVGRINSATEGSVSVATDYGTNVSQQMSFCLQSKYGSAWWAMTAQYRTMRYIPGSLQPGGLGYNQFGIGRSVF